MLIINIVSNKLPVLGRALTNLPNILSFDTKEPFLSGVLSLVTATTSFSLLVTVNSLVSVVLTLTSIISLLIIYPSGALVSLIL